MKQKTYCDNSISDKPVDSPPEFDQQTATYHAIDKLRFVHAVFCQPKMIEEICRAENLLGVAHILAEIADTLEWIFGLAPPEETEVKKCT